MPLSTDPKDVLFTPSEAAHFLRVSPHTIAWWRSHGRGPCYLKIGPAQAPGSIRYRLSDLQNFLEEIKPAMTAQVEVDHG